MKFQVPQFIEVEDKIVGPLSLKQFIYLAGGGGLCIILYLYLPLLIAIPIMLPVVTLSGALAFYKLNNRPFINLVESFFRYTTTNKLYIWKHNSPEVGTRVEKITTVSKVSVPKLSQSKLRDLSWSLDIQDEKKSGEGDELP